jgi:hypothetical protein
MRVELVMTLMPGLVFYSWQSDLPNATNRGFIGRALEAAAKALKNDDSIQVEPVIDRDTAGVPGSPNIAETVFRKIDQANVFVGDISIINRDMRDQATNERLTPNPNVLLELGYALKALGDKQVILVLNDAYGGLELLPFDLRMRRVICYHMEEGNSNRASERKDLEKVLMEALRASLSNADSSLLEIGNHSRPVLHPLNKLEGIIDSQSGLVQWGRQGISIAPMRGFENIGGGPAFNIYAIFFGKPFQHHPPRERYAVWNYGTLKAGEEGPPLTLSQGTSIESTNTINGHSLYVPDDPEHNGVLARLTITYHDTPGHKYASIYDYQRFLGWRRVSDVENIEYDLNELDAMHPMTQQANEFFWRLGQSRP